MKKVVVTWLIMGAISTALSQESKQNPSQKIAREGIEWCDIWIPSAPQTDKPRVLLIGDSITKGYYKSASAILGEEAYCVRFTTSACVADPAFHVQLQAMFTQYEYDVIHFNNGLHGAKYTEEEYRAGYEKALKYIQKESPSSKIILALSTPLNSQSNMNHMNPRITERNRIVQELGRIFGAEINDLHSISKDHPEYYIDAYHYNQKAIELQGRQVGDAVKALLNGKS